LGILNEGEIVEVVKKVNVGLVWCKILRRRFGGDGFVLGGIGVDVGIVAAGSGVLGAAGSFVLGKAGSVVFANEVDAVPVYRVIIKITYTAIRSS